MENGDSAHSEHTHRNCNNTQYYIMHGTRTVVLLIPLNVTAMCWVESLYKPSLEELESAWS